MKALILSISLFLIFQISIAQTRCPMDTEIDGKIPVPRYIHNEGPMLYNSKGWVIDPRFTDDFDVGPYPNTAMWNLTAQDTCNEFTKIGYSAYFTETNCPVYDGKLHLICKPDVEVLCDTIPLTNSSGWIGTVDKARFGYFEVKCLMPIHAEVQPCFWLFGEDGVNPGSNMTSPYSWTYDEIDVNECVIYNWPDTTLYHNNLYHRDYVYGYDHVHKYGYRSAIPYVKGLRGRTMVFALEWLPNEVNVYINGDVQTSYRFTGDERKISPPNWPYCSPSEYTCNAYQNSIGKWIQLSLTLRHPTTLRTYTYEVDYLHSYKLVDGGDDFYWPEEIYVRDSLLSRVHSSIKLGGDMNHLGIVPDISHINIWATDNILLDKGFECSERSSFTARIIQVSGDCFLPNK